MNIVGLLLLLIVTPTISGAQSCNPAVVDYIIRDEEGKILSEADLKMIAEQLPKTIGGASVDVGQVSLADDLKFYYRPESSDWPKGRKQPALEIADAATCTLHLTEITLTFHGKKMRLLFNIDITRGQSDRRPVIDSPPFQEGTFTLDMRDWQPDRNKVIPSEKWKKAVVGS